VTHPTCDLNGCERDGYVRYRHQYRDEWIDTCSKHTPSMPKKLLSRVFRHSTQHPEYPATTLSQVNRAHSFKHRVDRNKASDETGDGA